jgi:hypothetical protein
MPQERGLSRPHFPANCVEYVIRSAAAVSSSSVTVAGLWPSGSEDGYCSRMQCLQHSPARSTQIETCGLMKMNICFKKQQFAVNVWAAMINDLGSTGLIPQLLDVHSAPKLVWLHHS